MTKAKPAKVTPASRAAHADRVPHLLNDLLRQCELPEGQFSIDLVRKAAKILKCTHSQAIRKLGTLKTRGVLRVGLHRGASGAFITTPCPHPSIGPIMRSRPLATLKAALLANFDHIDLLSALSTNTGPKSKYLEIRTDNIVTLIQGMAHSPLRSPTTTLPSPASTRLPT